jgi:spermidine synthase
VAAMQGQLKYYNADLHRAAFALPSFIRDRIKLQGAINR